MSVFEDPRVYQALALPDDALDKGGIEILRAGVINDELYVSARNVLQDMAQWGEVLADITRRLGELVAAEGECSEQEAIAAIASAFAADLGAPAVGNSVTPRNRVAKRKAATSGKGSRSAASRAARAKKPARGRTKAAAKAANRKRR